MLLFSLILYPIILKQMETQEPHSAEQRGEVWGELGVVGGGSASAKPHLSTGWEQQWQRGTRQGVSPEGRTAPKFCATNTLHSKTTMAF